jgi:hypothetical protein
MAVWICKGTGLSRLTTFWCFDGAILKRGAFREMEAVR